jgi:hypothetical protein
LKALHLLFLLLVAFGSTAASASAASTAIGFSADPTEDKPVVVTISGTSDAARSLWVLRTTASSCAATVEGNAGGSELSSYYSGDGVSAGAYTRS